MKQSSNKEEDLLNEITENDVISEILDCISSEKVRDYLLLHKQEYSILQFATLVEEYINKSLRSKFFKALKEKTENLYEKELLQMAIDDYEKEGYISDKTNKYYLENDPRKENKPSYPFCEIVPIPILFKEGDVVTYQNGKSKEQAVIGRLPDELTYEDFFDEVYMAYDLDKNLDGDDFLSDVHVHLHICDINKISVSDLTPLEIDNLSKIKKELNL
ncbi:MAG: hypothetical protein K6E21_04225 [Bacilli bacterium]|nr:hypothetical protein [Bacilli bacterium]